MTLRLNGSTSGFTEIDAPAVAGSNTLTLPGGNGTNGQVLTTDGAGALSFTTVAGAGSLADGSAAAPSVAFASDVNTGIFRAGNDLLAFSTGGTERAQFDASGRLLVGTSTSVSVLGENKVQLFGENSGGSLSLTRTGATTQSANLVFGRTRGDASTRVSLNNDDVVGRIYFVGDDGTDIQTPAALIQVNVDGTPGANSMPGRIVLSTTASGASSPTERMRIRQDGALATFCAATTDAHQISSAASAGTTNYFIDGLHSASAVLTGTRSFRVYTNGNVQNTNNSYGALSDLKLKENIVDANSQWDDLKALQVRNYNFKPETNQQTHTQIGLIAQEAELVSPGLVSESPDRDEEGNDLNTVTKSVNYSVLYMKAVKALQEAIAKIETLEGMVAVNNITIDEQQHQLSTLEARLTALEVTP